jgi:hypothetical protein
MIDRTISYILGAVCVGLAVTSGMLAWELNVAERSEQRLRTTLATERAERAQERERLTAEALAASEAARALEARWRAQHTEVQTDAHAKIRAAAADAARARSAADGLQRRAEIIAAQCANPTRDRADPSFGGQATPDPGVVLTNLLRGVAQAAAEFAAVADARGAAGTACERAYDAISAPGRPPAP